MSCADNTFIAAERLLDSLRRPFTLEGKSVDISASVGIAFADDDGLRAEDLLVSLLVGGGGGGGRLAGPRASGPCAL